ncbi:sulfite exporter TauE/SafE family protein [Mucilaginibacter sp.]|uniref:sulfite exporter TauE/SafE family protein n=1 Tax=Mucilaginibacter sp. TaxID=1882438 RepID=UPI002ED06AE8
MLFTVLLLLVCALAAFILSAVCGGGASFILIPILGIVLPGAQIPAALSVGTASSSLSRIIVLWKNIRWDLVKWFIPPAIPTVWLGARLLSYFNPVFLELILGLFLLYNILYIFKSPQKRKPDQKSRLSVVIIGLLTGFVSGLTGAVGLIFNRFYLTYGLSKEEIVATRAANEIILHIIKLGLYVSFGLFTSQVLLYGGIIAFAGIVSSFGIKYLLPFLSEKVFQKIGYAAMVFSGVFLFAGGVGKIISNDNLKISLSPVSRGLNTSVQWKKDSFTLEFEYDEGFEFERKISLSELPASLHPKVTPLIKNSTNHLIEEVFSFREHYYELYTWKEGKVSKYNFK